MILCYDEPTPVRSIFQGSSFNGFVGLCYDGWNYGVHVPLSTCCIRPQKSIRVLSIILVHFFIGGSTC